MATNQQPATLAIIAGNGKFPFLVAAGARKAGLKVFVIGLSGLADPALAKVADEFRWSGLARLGTWIRLLRRRRISRVILAGSVRKRDMYARFRLLKLIPDLTTLWVWFFKLKDKRNDAVLRAVADAFASYGINMEPCTNYCPEDMAPEGVLTRRQPTPDQLRDATFGWHIAREMGRLDIGQSVAVKETEVIAVEAIEGTDRMIERAGELCPRGGWALIKVAKPNQDMRFDVPTVGPDTIVNLKKAGGAMLVVEAGMTLIVDRVAMIQAADAAGIVVMGMSSTAAEHV